MVFDIEQSEKAIGVIDDESLARKGILERLQIEEMFVEELFVESADFFGWQKSRVL